MKLSCLNDIANSIPISAYHMKRRPNGSFSLQLKVLSSFIPKGDLEVVPGLNIDEEVKITKKLQIRCLLDGG